MAYGLVVEANLWPGSERATPAMSDDNLLPFSFPAVQRKKITAAFDGGRITSDGGVMLLAQAERRLGIAERLAQVIPDRRDQDRVTHLVPDILRARIFAIACGYEDADDLDRLRCDPAFKLACGRLPDSGTDLCSQPTISRWENAPALRDLIRLMGVMVDLYCASYATPPAAVTLDIDDTVDVVHGHQQLSLFNAHYDERCFLPIHVYDTAVARPVAVLLRPGKPLPARRCAVTCVVSSAASAGTGRKPGSPSVATPITAARRSWSGATRMGSTSSSVYPATACLTGWSMKPPTTFAPAGHSTSNPVYAASPRPGTGRNPGARSAAPALGSRPPRRASTSASSSPASRRDRPSISTRRSTALAARPRTSLNCTRHSSLPTAPAAAVRSPTRCV